MNGKFFIFILSLFILVSCDWFERQDHNITEPEIPTFKVYGYVRRISTGEGVQGLELLLYQEESYDGAWIDQIIIYTDENGYFEFNKVPRGKFYLYIYTSNDDLIDTVVFGVINYDDKELNIAVPL